MDARHRATTELRDFLRSQLAEYPPEEGARHFVIAHSHGGNIALYALRDPELAHRLSGVACFATPFLYVRRRPYNPIYLIFVFGAAMALAVGYPLGVLLPRVQGYLTDLSSGLAIVLMMLVLGLAFAAFWVAPTFRRYNQSQFRESRISSDICRIRKWWLHDQLSSAAASSWFATLGAQFAEWNRGRLECRRVGHRARGD